MTTIAAPPAAVWSVLTDVAAWPRWDSGVTAVDGRLALGDQLRVSLAADTARPVPFTVVELTAPARIVLRGGLPMGLFTGERTYALTALDGGTRFTLREDFTGPLARFIFRTIPDLGSPFRQFAAGLRDRVEHP